MQMMVRDINNLRWAHPALRSASGTVVHVDRAKHVIAFKRYNFEGDVLLVVVNVSDDQWAFHDYGVLVGSEGGEWREVFNSQAPVYGACDTTGNFDELLWVREGKLFVNLPRWSVVVLRRL